VLVERRHPGLFGDRCRSSFVGSSASASCRTGPTRRGRATRSCLVGGLHRSFT
jgi:hypothetical protein